MTYLTAISLFSGAGGLDLGLKEAGFRAALNVEFNDSARNTLLANLPESRPSFPSDIHELSPGAVAEQANVRSGEVVLLHGGPPCQPFSKSGQWVNGETPRFRDPRARTLRAMFDLVDYLLPQTVLLENVEGLISSTRNGATWIQKRFNEINRRQRTAYVPVVVKLNAADFGVPQHRIRIFVIAQRDGKKFQYPERLFFPPDLAPKRNSCWRTAWDAIGQGQVDGELEDDLELRGKWAELLPSIPEGENYLWHTDRGGGLPIFGWRRRYWTFLLKLAKSRPSWTIQAAPGPSTGPFHWNNRRLSIRELAALQSFPCSYRWHGSEREIRSQIGNAVPPALAAALGASIVEQLLELPRPNVGSFIPTQRKNCPPPEPAGSVPRAFRSLGLDCTPHPGTGLGPRASVMQQEM